ncbi:MAG: DUF1592 domain-containing protein [Myxococcota bacterium]
MKNGIPIALLALFGCSGELTPLSQDVPSESASAADDDSFDNPAPPDAPACNQTVSHEPKNLLRLTREQYRNVIADVLAMEIPPAEVESILALALDDTVGSFKVNHLPPSTAMTDDYLDIAISLGATTRQRQLSGAIDLDPSGVCPASNFSGDRGCVEEVVRNLAARLFRARDVDSEVAHYLTTYDTVRASENATAMEAFDTALAAVWNSPRFIYRVETADPAGNIDEIGLATRLSFLIWNSVPDLPLLDLATDGALRDNLDSEVRRMLADPRATRARHRFYEQLLHLEGFGDLELPDDGWNNELRSALERETYDFVDYVYDEGDGTVQTLLSADFTVGDARVAAHYGVDGPSTDVGRFDLPPERRGLLTQGSLLAMRGTHFPEVHRALFIRDTIMCDPVPEVTFDIPDEGAEFRLTEPQCASCHTFIDPLGFAFLDYDSAGRYDPISDDSRASLPATPALNVIAFDSSVAGEISDTTELISDLSESDDVAACFAKHWMAYAFSVTDLDALEVSCHQYEFTSGFSSSGADLRTLVSRVVNDPAFQRKGTEVSR